MSTFPSDQSSKTETGSRIARMSRMIQFEQNSAKMQSDMYAEASWRAPWRCSNWPRTCPQNNKYWWKTWQFTTSYKDDGRKFALLKQQISKYTRIPNFGEMSQSTAEILLLPASENKRPPCWNSTSGSDFYICFTIDMSFCICLLNFVQIGPSAAELWRHIHFSRWRPGYRNSTSDFGFRDLAHLGSRNLPAYQIWARYLNLRLIYYYFRFLKTNVLHVGVLLPVQIFTFASPLACHFASVYQLSSKSDHPRQSYDVIFIFQDGGR